MREIVERGDLIHVDGVTYLVAPVSARCIDAMAAFESEGEDRVNDLCDEPDANAEPDADDEPGEDAEPDVDDEPDYDNEPKYEGMTLGERGPGHGRVSPAVVNPATGELRRWVSLR
jgi:hypothetical protein